MRRSIEKKIKNSFDKVKQELDDHLTAINENTSEIQSIYDYLHVVEEKLDKLNEKINNVELFLSTFGLKIIAKKDITLNLNEQQVFVLLMKEKDFVSYKKISSLLGFKEDYLCSLINSLLEKNVPVVKLAKKEEEFVKLDDKFREMQEKEGIIKINPIVETEIISLKNKKLSEFWK